MPPGFANQCPYGLVTAFTPWVTVLWVIVYALCVETALLGLGLLAPRLWRAATHSASAPLLLVAGSAGCALAVAAWITSRDLPFCLTPPSLAHVTLAQAMQAQRLYTERLTQTHVAVIAPAAVFVLATALTVMAFIRAWRASRRGSRAARA